MLSLCSRTGAILPSARWEGRTRGPSIGDCPSFLGAKSLPRFKPGVLQRVRAHSGRTKQSSICPSGGNLQATPDGLLDGEATSVSFVRFEAPLRAEIEDTRMVDRTDLAGRKELCGIAMFFVMLMLVSSYGWAADSNKEQSEISNRLAESTKVLDDVMASQKRAISAGILVPVMCVAIFPFTG